jgi:hypothetical protein
VYLLIACTLSALASIAAIAVPELSRWLLATALVTALAIIGLWSPFASLLMSIVYIVLQGLLRRLLPDADDSALGDPLLLVLPALSVFLTAVHVRRAPLDLLAKVILGIQLAMAISIVNPLGAGVTSGVAQFIVVALPLTWFWVASRAVAIDTHRLRTLLGLTVVLGVVVALYGRYQVSEGFPPWDEAWIEDRGLNSLFLGQFIRPFSTFTAPSDYATFVGLSLMAAAALLLSRNTRSIAVKLVLLAACCLFVYELVVQGSRGILLTSVLPVVVGLMVRLGIKLRYALAGGLGILLLLPGLIGNSSETAVTDATTTNSAAVARQAQGFSDPFGEESTLPGHIDRLVDGVKSGFESPLGRGVGVIGLGTSFQSGVSLGTETAYGDLGVSIGLVGTVLGLMFAVALLWRIAHQPRTRRDEAYWLVLFLGLLPLGPPLSAGSYATQVTHYALLGCAWVLLSPRPTETVPAAKVEAVTSGRTTSRGPSPRPGSMAGR